MSISTNQGFVSSSTRGGKHVLTPSQASFDIKYDAPAQGVTHVHDHGSSAERSRFTNLILPFTAKWPLLHAIVTEKDSRRIFYFMRYAYILSQLVIGVSIGSHGLMRRLYSINFSFMMIQAFYGYATDSLGLLSDSIHMLFDCVALAVGLFASVASKWAPNERFPYGFGKIETLSGFANGVFLM